MLPGPDITMACGFCRGPVLKGSLLSGNTFNSTLWSDGKLHAPMNPGGKLLVKCPHCDALLLPADLNHTDTGWGGVTPRDDVEAARVESIEPEDLLRVIERRVTRSEERQLRVHYWWTMNNPRRRDPDHPTELSDLEVENLERLLELTQRTPYEERLRARDGERDGERDEELDGARLTRAEIKRALGDFEGAQEEAGRVESEDLKSFAAQISALASEGERRVARLSR